MTENTFKSWDKYGTSLDLERLSREALDIIGQNKTERELVKTFEARVKSAGAVSLTGTEKITAGDYVFMNWRNRAFAAARIGRQKSAGGFNLIASHGDSPRIDVKGRPIYEKGNLALFDCQYYGGIKKYQWTNVPLALHGEIYDTQGQIHHLVIGEKVSDPLLIVPDLEPHIDRDLAKRSAAEAVTGENLDAIIASKPGKSPDDEKKLEILFPLKSLLKKEYGLDDSTLASADLALVPAGPAREVGFDRGLLAAYGLDDRICASASLLAQLDMEETPERTAVCFVYDKEEIGSDGIAGADGAFLEAFTLELLRGEGSPTSALALQRSLAKTCGISADVTSGCNPLYESSYVRDQQPLVGNGVVIVKVSGSGGEYSASEARGEYMAKLISILDKEGIPWQVGSFGIIDKAGGGTLAMYLARRGIDIIDVGPALISMHSPMELGSKSDFAALYHCYRAFWENMLQV